MKYVINNKVDNINIISTNNDKYFITIVNKIQNENADDLFIIQTVNQAIKYINEFCDNLSLTIND